jgi:hypothetical protein
MEGVILTGLFHLFRLSAACRGWQWCNRSRKPHKQQAPIARSFPPLTLVLNRADGTSNNISVNHTYNEQQIDWFKEGAALNIIRKQFAG